MNDLDAPEEAGIGGVVTVVGHRGEEFVGTFGDAYRGRSLSSLGRAEPRGTAGAVVTDVELDEGSFLVLHGDNVLDTDLDRLVARRRGTGGDVTLLVDDGSPAEARADGLLPLDDAGAPGGAVEWPEAPPSTVTSRDAYGLGPSAPSACRGLAPSVGGEYEGSDAIDRLLASGRRVETVPREGACVNVNAPTDLEPGQRLVGG